MSTKTAAKLQYSHTVGFMSLQGGRGFANPVDMVFDTEGAMYVLSRGGSDGFDDIISKRITKCTVDEEYLGQFSGGGTEDGKIMWPSSIAMDAQERVYVADEALHRISVFEKGGRYLYKWGRRGRGEGEFDRPAGIIFDANGVLLVTDSLNNRVQRYTQEGQFISQWGSAGDGDGEFNMPWGLASDTDGNIYVADWRNDRIQKFSADGEFLKAWNGSDADDGTFNRPSGLAVDGDGVLYVADWGNERVQVMTQEGECLANLRGESGLSKWAHEYFSTNMDELEEREKANLEPQLEYPSGDHLRQESAMVEKLFWGPTTVKIDAQGRVYVVDTARARVQVFEWSD